MAAPQAGRAHAPRAIAHALAAAARAHERRVPFFLGPALVGSVAVAHLSALRRFPGHLRVADSAVSLQAREPTAALAIINAQLRAQGLVRAWRDETYPIPDLETLRPLAHIERAASRFWGTLTFGAHATGYVAGGDARPSHLWIARRSPHKATDPGLFDNLIGGGVPAGQTPLEALIREGFEEAGLAPAQLAGARAAGALRLQRDIAEGFQHEWLFSFDVELPPGTEPANQDGEVAGFTLLPVDEAAALAAGESMTVDAALVTLDFLLRHGLLEHAPGVAERLASLRVIHEPRAAR